MSQQIAGAAVACLAALAGASCGGGPSPSEVSSSPAPAAVRPEDARPRERTQDEVRRIVSLAPNITEILFALGLGDRVVGVTEYCNFPPEAARLPKVGGFVNPNAETILGLRPDLVVATPNVGNRPFVERVIHAGARVEVVEARNVEEIFPAIMAIARAAGVEPRGSRLVGSIREALDRETARVATLARPRVLFCIQIEPLVVAAPGSYPGDLVRLAGGENIAPASRNSYPSMSLEAVLAAAPEAIVQSLMDTPDGSAGASTLMTYWRRFESIPAVGSGRVYTVSGDLVLRPGPRVAEGVAALIALLHPDARRTVMPAPRQSRTRQALAGGLFPPPPTLDPLIVPGPFPRRKGSVPTASRHLADSALMFGGPRVPRATESRAAALAPARRS